MPFERAGEPGAPGQRAGESGDGARLEMARTRPSNGQNETFQWLKRDLQNGRNEPPSHCLASSTADARSAASACSENLVGPPYHDSSTKPRVARRALDEVSPYTSTSSCCAKNHNGAGRAYRPESFCPPGGARRARSGEVLRGSATGRQNATPFDPIPRSANLPRPHRPERRAPPPFTARACIGALG